MSITSPRPSIKQILLQLTRIAAGLALPALIFSIYHPGLQGAFLLDDYHVIVTNTNIQVEEFSVKQLTHAALSSDAGVLKRPVSMLSFALNHLLLGPSASSYKLINVCLHLICGLLVFVLAQQLCSVASPHLDRFRFGLFTAAIWSAHPLLVSTVLYASQRMTILAALFSLASWILYNQARIRGDYRPSRRTELFVFSALFAAVATLSKESGILTPLFWAITELTLLRRTWSPNFKLSGAQKLLLYGILTALLSFAAYIVSTRIVPGYAVREFTLEERLLTEFRVLCLYLKMLAIPTLPDMTLYHDDISLSTGLLAPPTTLLAIAFLGGLAVIAITSAKQYPWLSFGLGVFFVGHALESTIIALEIAYEHRNYLPSIGLSAALSWAVMTIPATNIKGDRAPAIILSLITLSLAGLTYQRASTWGGPLEMLKHGLTHHPNSARTQLWAGDTFVQIANRLPTEKQPTYLTQAKQHFQRAYQLNNRHISALFEIVRIDHKLGEPDDNGTAEMICNALRSQWIHASTALSLGETWPPSNPDDQSLENRWQGWRQCALENDRLNGPNREHILRLPNRI